MVVERSGESTMTGQSAIPGELAQFLAHDSCSLLIKGGAGTGKTALALTILRILDAKGRFLYLSTRTSTNHFLEYYPWLRGWFGIPAPKGKARPGTQAPAELVDARLDEPSQLFERITSELMNVRASVIVIDAWDSLREFDEGESLASNMKVLRSWCERANARLIVIKEDPLDTSLDHVVDGVVTLKQGEIEGRRVREMYISKLQGVNVESPSYLFTLRDGMFRAFRHYNEAEFFALAGMTRRTGEETRSSAGLYSTGYRELDSVLGGGLSPSSMVNFELGSEVHSKTALVLLISMITESAKVGRPVVLFPLHGIDEDFATDLLKNSMPPARMRLVTQLSSSPSDAGSSGGRKSTGGVVEEWIRSTQRDRRGEGAVLAIIGGSHLRSGSDTPTHLDAFAGAIRSGGSAAVVVTGESDRALAQHMSTDGAMHIRVEMLKGTLLVQPQRPSSKFLAAEVQTAPSNTTVCLEPLV